MKRTVSVLVVLIAAALLAAPLLFADVEEYKKAVELDGNSVIKRYNLGYAYYNDGKYDDAVDTLKTALDMNRSDSESHAKVDAAAAQILGIIFYNYKNDDDEAIKYFNRVAELNPSDGDNYYYTGLAYLRKGDNDRAMQDFSSALAKGTGNQAEAEFRIGQIYYKKNQFGDAIPRLEKASAKGPRSDTAVDAMEMLGIIYHKRGEADKAIEDLLAVVKARPDNYNAYFLLGLNYFKQKKYEKMLSAYKKAIEIKPDYADAHYNLGMAYYYRNEFEDAIKEFGQAKALNPDDSAVYSILAQSKTAAYEYHLSRGTTDLTDEKYPDAINEFNLALAAKPDDADAKKYLDNAGDALKKKIPEMLASAKQFYAAGRYAEAYNQWDFVRQADPSNSEAQDGIKKIEKNLSDLVAAKEKSARDYTGQGNFDAAIADLKSVENMVDAGGKAEISGKIAAVREKQKAKVRSLLASADRAYSGEAYKSALEKYNEVLKYDQANDDALNGITKVNAGMDADKEKYLALAEQNKGNGAKSARYFKKVLEIDPTNMEAQNGIEQATGKKSQVALDAGRVRELYYQGVDRYVNGDIDNAIKLWKKVLEIDPTLRRSR